MNKSLPLFVLTVFIGTAAYSEEAYNFRASAAYSNLSAVDQKKLDQVHHDLVLLRGALDLYAERNNNQAPEKLSKLVPIYLKELPADPFATSVTASETNLGSQVASLKGFGYRYQPGIGNAFSVSSVGLRGFPYNAARGNVDLYLTRGKWISGEQLVPLNVTDRRKRE
jgi:hypothetical protein